MFFNINDFRDKVYACWIGKNIGGTIGGPFEFKKDFLDVKGYTTPKGEPLPNDDLDLQLVWLHDIEKIGIGQINTNRLAESWLSFIMPHWNEYGICKANMRRGLESPICGEYKNEWKNSNGAWIRTEIWACLQPGRPDVALSFAIEDALVDHGCGEGTYAAAFVAALQSTAFVVKDIRDCIEVAYSKIPEDCRVAKSVRLAIESYEKGLDLRTARDLILNSNMDIGDGWMEAPSNIGYTILGLLYGEGDFKKSVLAAVNCGDDTDCTAGTVGATLGIMGGMAAIPEDWREYIGDAIITKCIDRTTCSRIPNTCTELTNRVVALAPQTVKCGLYYMCIPNAHIEPVSFGEEANDIPENIKERLEKSIRGKLVIQYRCRPYTYTTNFHIAKVSAVVEEGIDIGKNQEKTIRLYFETNMDMIGNIPLNMSIRWWLPEGWTVEGKKNVYIPAWRVGQGVTWCEEEYIINSGDNVLDLNRIVAEFTVPGRVSSGYLPIVFIG